MYKDTIDYAEKSEFNNIKKLFDDSFSEDLAFNEWFFKNAYKAENTIVYRRNDKIIGMLQNIPCQIDKFGRVSYIYGACTEEKSRRQGIMPKLIAAAFEEDERNNICASVLIPQNTYLFNYYERFGYKTAFYLNTSEHEATGEKSSYSIIKAKKKDISAINDIYESSVNIPHIKRNSEYIEKQISLFEYAGGDAVIISDNAGTAIGYAFLWKTEIPYLQEFFCIGDSQNALNAIAAHCGVRKIKYSQQGKGTPFGVVRFHSEIALCDNMYMNLMFN